jgi:asparagine synthase (glutamine-hydrolysing)
MPGICGSANTSERPRSPELLPAMLRRLRQSDQEREESQEDLAVALGRISLGYVNTAPQPAAIADDMLRGVMDGELYDIEVLRRSLQHLGPRIEQASQAELLLHGFHDQGLDFLRKVHGSFAMAIYDHRRQALHLVTDRFGTRPLYWAAADEGLVFASTIKTLLAEPSLSREINPTGLAQFFTFGHYLRDDTSLADVRVVSAASCLSWSAAGAEIAEESYWDVRQVSSSDSASNADLMEQIDHAFSRAVERRVTATEGLGLALSGGLDARTILGVADTQQTPLKTVCLGMAGSLDHRSAARLAELAGCEHTNHILGQGFLGQFRNHAETMVRLTDGQYLSQCIVMPTLPIYQQLGIRVLLRGHAGELMHMHKAYNYSLDQEALAIDSRDSLGTWLFRRLQAYMLDGVEKPVFREAYQRDLAGLARESLEHDLNDTQGDGPALQQIWRLFITQRLRRETVLSLMKFRSVVEPRLPFLDNDLIELLLAAPPGRKLGEEMQSYILRKRRPEFLNVVNANTGARLGASSLHRKITSLQMRVLAKLGAPGYQPYERLGLWLRRELAPTVRDILLSEQCLERGVYDPAGVRQVVDQHVQGRNHTFLLMGLMIFELGQRYLSDETAGETEAQYSHAAAGHSDPALGH